MTLDEQIAWLEQQACMYLRYSQRLESDDRTGQAKREKAATLLTIENTLRGLRDAQG